MCQRVVFISFYLALPDGTCVRVRQAAVLHGNTLNLLISEVVGVLGVASAGLPVVNTAHLDGDIRSVPLQVSLLPTSYCYPTSYVDPTYVLLTSYLHPTYVLLTSYLHPTYTEVCRCSESACGATDHPFHRSPPMPTVALQFYPPRMHLHVRFWMGNCDWQMEAHCRGCNMQRCRMAH